MKKVGFTGTRKGMSSRQKEELFDLLQSGTIFHHGDCVGADAEAHATARALGCPVVVHPPTDPKARAFCNGDDVTILDPLPYLARNREIVKSVELLIAAPKEDPEHPCLRSGTWATIRAAQRLGVPVIILKR